MSRAPVDPLSSFAEPVRAWFAASFRAPTPAQAQAFPHIASGASTLLLAPTGSGKTLAAFLASLDRLAFGAEPAREKQERLAVVYVSPLKALAVDVERNLRAPLVGIAQAATRLGVPFREPTIALRSGDTPPKERAAFLRQSADILITTPESLYLLLSSEARSLFAGVRTVIVDEIHALVGQKRGTHLFLSLERLEALRRADAPPLQRVGLSATQRPLELVARALGGESSPGTPRPVQIVDAGIRRTIELRVEVPVEDMGALPPRGGSATLEPEQPSIWASIHPRLLELVRGHRTTMIFVNNRRLAERLAAALNELAGEEVALAHHGSLALSKRQEIEDRLKRGKLPAIVATSSLELGIDMGSVDLVVLVEAPPSVASGLQRVGRAGHRIDAVPEGVLMPKHRGDLLASAAIRSAMLEGAVEPTSLPENPLDVLAQQVVAQVAMGPVAEPELHALVRRAAPYASLPRSAWEGVLDMLSGRYPSDDFAELRPRITWDRTTGMLTPRHGARRLAVLSGGTIPDRGLYGVYLLGSSETKPLRVGELDEEMVFESRPGEVFLLGASSWRIEEITHDRVLVSPAPGEPGKMPFWRGDKPGRPVALGLRIGALARTIAALPRAKATRLLEKEHGLDRRAAQNLVAYLEEQRELTGEVPSDEVVVVERFPDELGDERVCVLSPLGARVLAPWAMAVQRRLSDERGLDVELLWSDDGIVFRLPEGDAPVPLELFIPSPDEVEALVLRGLDRTSLYAARFRENAGRALLLPRKLPGKRSPLWAQRKRASDLLAVASRFGSFPIVLETYRECLRDVFDLPALVELLRRVQSGQLRVVEVESREPSPFAASLLFSYVASFLYDGDVPLAERRAQALSLDQERLRELLGEVELSELLDPTAIDEVEARLSHLSGRKIAHADGLHDLLLVLGDLGVDEIRARSEPGLDLAATLAELVAARRIVPLRIAGAERYVAVEEVARYRDALGVSPPPGLPSSLLEPVEAALSGLVARHARTHGPFGAEALDDRYGIGRDPLLGVLRALHASGRLVEGSFRPGGASRQWCDAEVLRQIKRASLAKLRREVEPVSTSALARFALEWHELERPRAGLEALLATIERLEGLVLPVSVWLEDVLPARVRGFSPSDLDDLCAAGEIVWRAVDRLGSSDARISLHLTDRYQLLAQPSATPTHARAGELLALFERRGAMFFGDISAQLGGYAPDLLDALWDLAFSGLLTNDTTLPLRALYASGTAGSERRGRDRLRRPGGFVSRRQLPRGSEGRWALLPRHGLAPPSETDRRAALVEVLLSRHGLLTRETLACEDVPGGFSAIYPVLRAMEESGRIRRGYFVEGLGGLQFARPGAEERLRSCREAPEAPRVAWLAALDPANPYGATLPWPACEPRPQRTAGARVLLRAGALLAYLARGGKALTSFLPGEEPERAHALEDLAAALAAHWRDGSCRSRHLARIDGEEAPRSPLAPRLEQAGFVRSGKGLRGPSAPRG